MKKLKKQILTNMTFVLFALSGMISGAVIAQELRIPVGQQGDANIVVPKRGISKEVVLQQFGEPYNAVDDIGEPPISTWYYSNFNVYFESDKVIHSVLKHSE